MVLVKRLISELQAFWGADWRPAAGRRCTGHMPYAFCFFRASSLTDALLPPKPDEVSFGCHDGDLRLSPHRTILGYNDMCDQVVNSAFRVSSPSSWEACRAQDGKFAANKQQPDLDIGMFEMRHVVLEFTQQLSSCTQKKWKPCLPA